MARIMHRYKQRKGFSCFAGCDRIGAEAALVEPGYTNIKEFGGIIDWPYEVEKP